MRHDSYFHAIHVILGFLAMVLIGLLLGGCGTTWRLEYSSPPYGNGAVEFTLPTKEGYAK